MFTTRNVVVGVVALFVSSLFWSVWSLMRPPDSGGIGGDTYGTRRHGLRALYETLTDLHLPVERGLSPPTFALDRKVPVTLVFWKPDVTLIHREPAYLKIVGDWLRQGGRVVVAFQDRERTFEEEFAARGSDRRERKQAESHEHPAEEFFEALQVRAVGFTEIDLIATPPNDANKPVDRQFAERRPNAQQQKLDPWDQDFKRIQDLMAGEKNLQPSRAMKVLTTGALESVGEIVRTLELPIEHLQVLQLKNSQPAGLIQFIDLQGQQQTLGAHYRVGQGELIVLGSAKFAENRLLAHGDNSVLATALIAGDGRPVVFDEFYHGLTVRGNPMWLFTRQGYGIVALGLLTLVGLWTWRGAVFLGPPLAETIPSRRSIGEYVIAMAAFLNRGQVSRAFLLQEVRTGVLQAIRRELGLPPGRENVEELAAVLQRRNPRRADQLLDAVRNIDQALSQNVALREADAIRLLQGISSCL